MKESFFSKNNKEELDNVKKAVERAYDALGISYTCFSEVMDQLDDMRADLKPDGSVLKMIESYKKKNEDISASHNPVEYWAVQSRKCESVLQATRLYLEANAQQFPGIGIIKNRIIYLANKGKWK